MLRNLHTVSLALVAAVIVATPVFAQGTSRGRYYTKGDVDRVIKRFESHADSFKKAVDRNLDKSVLDGSKREDRMNDQIQDLDDATDRLHDKFDKSDRWEDTRENVQDVLRETRDINELYNRTPAYSKVKKYWVAVKTDANTLAGIYNLPKIQ